MQKANNNSVQHSYNSVLIIKCPKKKENIKEMNEQWPYNVAYKM